MLLFQAHFTADVAVVREGWGEFQGPTVLAHHILAEAVAELTQML